ncbi:MAG: PP2C family protein-serine/threonine phosphatase [Anaerolineales bacterium]
MARTTGLFTRPFGRNPQRDHASELNELGEHLRDTIDIDLLTIKSVVGLNDIYDLEHSAVFTRLDDVYAVTQAAGDVWGYPPTVPFDDPMVEMVRASEIPLRPADVGDMSPGWLFLAEREVRRVVPLLADEELIGFIAMGRKREPRRYSPEELQALYSFGVNVGRAYRLALQVRARQAEALDAQRESAERNALQKLQRSLVLARIPEVRRWDLAGVSEPAPNPTGNWYEFTAVDDRTVVVTLGAVEAAGLDAVHAMALASSAMRVEATHTPSPAELLSRVNYMLGEQLPRGRQLAVITGRLDTRSGVFQYATAGSTAPLVLAPKNPEARGYEADGILMGTFPNITYKLHQLEVPPGGSLLLYTPGVIQTATPIGDEFGLGGLKEAVRGRNNLSPGRLTASILTRIRTFLGRHPLTADITLAALRRQSF